MTTQFASERVRATIFAILSERGVTSISETEPLFSTGRLDSLAAAEVLALLEGDYGVDLASDDFDITSIDTLAELENLVASTLLSASAGAPSPRPREIDLTFLKQMRPDLLSMRDHP